MKLSSKQFSPKSPKGKFVKIKIQTLIASFILLSMIISACSPASQGQATTAESSTNTEEAVGAAQETATVEPAAADEAEPANLVIAPETLGQLRFFWNAEFPGEVSTSDTNIGCTPELETCTLPTNITAYAFSPDGNTLAVGVCEGLRTEDRSKENSDFFACSGESSIILYDSLTGEERGRLNPAALPLSLAFHPDGTILAAGLANSDIELWDVLNGEVSTTLSGSPRFVGIERLAFALDGNLLISSFVSAFQLSVWDWRSAESPTLIDRTRAFGVSPDGRSLVTTSFGSQVGDAARVRIYDLTQLDQFTEIALEDEQLPPLYFAFNPTNGWISGTEGKFAVVADFWDTASLSLVAGLQSGQENEVTGMYYDLNSGGFTLDGYFVLNRVGELLAPEAQPEATGLDEILWECGFALADVEMNQVFYISHPMRYSECIGPEYMHFDFLIEPLILSPDGRFIAGENGSGSLRLWGIDPSLPAVEPACYGDC
jgi:WD40 repeat protein